MSACASFPRVQERTRPVRLFEPEEVATVIDLFTPLAQARMRAANSGRGFDWPRLAAAIALGTGVCVVGAALLAGPPVVAPRLRPAAVLVTPVAPPAPAMAPQPPPPPPSEAPPAAAPIVAVVIEPRPLSPMSVLATLNRAALAAHRRGQPAAALAALARGVRLCQRPALAWNDLCARTHLHAGVVLAAGHRQTGLAARHFRIARAIQPGLGLPAQFRNRATVAAFDDARRR
jgi:hypothetical protein